MATRNDGRKTSLEARIAIITVMSMFDWSARRFTREGGYDTQHSTVTDIWNHTHERARIELGSSHNLPWHILARYIEPFERSGRPLALNSEQHSTLRQAFLENPYKPFAEVALDLDMPCKSATAQRVARQTSHGRPSRIVKRKRPKKPTLNAIDLVFRRKYSRWLLNTITGGPGYIPMRKAIFVFIIDKDLLGGTLFALHLGNSLDLYPTASRRPSTKEELFNLRHSSLRNHIERNFGIFKMRWQVFRKQHRYSLQFQAQLVMALTAVSNLIVREGQNDLVFEDWEMDAENSFEGAGVDERSSPMAQRREAIATAMWTDYQGYLEAIGL